MEELNGVAVGTSLVTVCNSDGGGWKGTKASNGQGKELLRITQKVVVDEEWLPGSGEVQVSKSGSGTGHLEVPSRGHQWDGGRHICMDRLRRWIGKISTCRPNGPG